MFCLKNIIVLNTSQSLGRPRNIFMIWSQLQKPIGVSILTSSIWLCPPLLFGCRQSEVNHHILMYNNFVSKNAIRCIINKYRFNIILRWIIIKFILIILLCLFVHSIWSIGPGQLDDTFWILSRGQCVDSPKALPRFLWPSKEIRERLEFYTKEK